MSKTRAKRSTRLIIVVANSLIDWLLEQKNQQLTVIFANSRSFSLIHDAHSESKMQSSFSKRKFQTLTIFFWLAYFYEWFEIFKSTIFFWLAYLYEWFDDFLLICVSLQMIRRFSLITRVLLRVIWRFYFVYSRTSTSNSLETENLSECQLVSQNSKREILLCWKRENDLVIVIAIDREIALKTSSSQINWNFVLKMKSSRIESSCFFLLADDVSECEVYIARHDENQI